MQLQGTTTRQNTLKFSQLNLGASNSNSGVMTLAESQLPKLGNVTVVRPGDNRGSSVSSTGEEHNDTFEVVQVVPVALDPTMIQEETRQSDRTLKLRGQESAQPDLKSLPSISGQRSNILINGPENNARNGPQNPFGDVITTQTNQEYVEKNSGECFSSARHSLTVSQTQDSEYI